MPKWIAVGEYHTRTSVESCAGTPSTGSNCEKPESTAACDEMGPSSIASIEIERSARGGRTAVRSSRPECTAGDARLVALWSCATKRKKASMPTRWESCAQPARDAGTHDETRTPEQFVNLSLAPPLPRR